MSCDSNDNELKLTKEYKYLLSSIRPLIDQLDKQRDAQLCLLWLSKLEECAICERSYRNKILSELCKQVKLKCLKPPFNCSPPSGRLSNVIFGREMETSNWNTNTSEDEVLTEEMSSISQRSCTSLKNTQRVFPLHWKDGQFSSNFKRKECAKTIKGSTGHSECYAIQKAYHERAQNDQMVIEKYQEIVKSLASQQLKAEIYPCKLKKMQAIYENKLAELRVSLQKSEEENVLLNTKIKNIIGESKHWDEVKIQNETLKKKITELEDIKILLEAKVKQVEEEKFVALKDVMENPNETEQKTKENEKLCVSLHRKFEKNCYNVENEIQGDTSQKQKSINQTITLEKLLDEKKNEIISLKKKISSQSAQFQQEISKLKQDIYDNLNVKKNKKIKLLKNKAKQLEKITEHMVMVFQSQLQQILDKKDFYIATLEMQLKISRCDFVGDNVEADVYDSLHKKISDLEIQYRKLLEDSEQQFLKQRQLDIQRIHTLENQLLMFGGVIEDKESQMKIRKTRSLTSVTENKNKLDFVKIF